LSSGIVDAGHPQHAAAIDRVAVRAEPRRGDRDRTSADADRITGVTADLDDARLVVQADPDVAIFAIGAAGVDRQAARHAVASSDQGRPQDALVLLAEKLVGVVDVDHAVAVDVERRIDHAVAAGVDAVLGRVRELGDRALPAERAVGDERVSFEVDRRARRTVSAVVLVLAAVERARGRHRGKPQHRRFAHRRVAGDLAPIVDVDLGHCIFAGVGDPDEPELDLLDVRIQDDLPLRAERDLIGIIVLDVEVARAPADRRAERVARFLAGDVAAVDAAGLTFAAAADQVIALALEQAVDRLGAVIARATRKRRSAVVRVAIVRVDADALFDVTGEPVGTLVRAGARDGSLVASARDHGCEQARDQEDGAQ
jgi:hypothetical protein